MAEQKSSKKVRWTVSLLSTLALVAVVTVLFVYAYDQAFRGETTCSALLVDRYSVPSQTCEGAVDAESTTGRVIGRAADLAGMETGETLVPGLAPVIDGPLDSVRRLSVAAFLLLLLLTAMLLSIVAASTKLIGRLLARDPETWRRLLVGARRYLLVVLGLYGLSVLLLRPF